MRRFIALALVVGGSLAVPAAAGAEEPLTCKLVNSAWTKVTGDPYPIVYCIDDPQPSPW